ncbi:DNA cytosine methyltransferase [Lactobacillus delbrueckii subsp. lactis]|uniref:DNA cytosine methyltransferase n=1 Tax=Lactobacillus delbrueckii TaxID=1584 RepID=UPI000691F69D|nr:DNA cytosine methyltransferase [Lactobacillus delbrueckii]MCD5507034.1 DNA cytosine methyltransferase [Lactobacillus delbrueckii subsp. lactis]MCD5520231.1 DNA cytosine methyltransferase [Lactobacillus delbrueckii subsp. lactis]MCD5524118.1 DNA cytosine methyltransferase [Lactobacillus delbrueckii subsp. lactis]MCD5526014.1 DNA cytosine methyltransferase [Lactobacillus delbrueckii subsp. lactis]MCT3482813.1 NgoBV family restriction endonuclease [Lactobacillus delbrueckii subsp. lactis]
MANRGGYRPNSGRKKKQHPKKKVQIYIDEELEKRINSVTIGKVNSVSSKICTLISKGIDSMLQEDNNVIRFADLFAGMGGIRLGFDRALKRHGLVGKPVFVSEIKKSAITVYKSNFGNEQITGDITKVDAEDIPDLDYIWNYENSPAFDIANFDSFYNVLYNDPEKLFAKYMTIGYVPTKHGFTIKYTDIKSLAELLGPSKKYPIGLQVKRGRPYAVRPANFKKKDYKHFENLDELILAVKDTRDMFPLSLEEEKYTSTQWLEKLKEEINRHK